MTDDHTLHHIVQAFDPYVKTPDQLHDIRLQIASHIESLKLSQSIGNSDSQSSEIPSHVTGLRRRYLQANQDNILARQRYADLQSAIESDPNSSRSSSSPASVLPTHLKLLRLRKENKQYQLLSQYAIEAEELATRNRIFDTKNMVEMTPMGDSTPPVDISPLVAEAQILRMRLERAVLQANHQLKHEQQLLDEVKSRTKLSENAHHPGAKLHALLATRAELTRWVEESLAKCDAEHAEHEEGYEPTEVGDQDGTSHRAQAAMEQYEKYLKARKRLLAASTAFAELGSTLSSTGSRLGSATTKSRPTTSSYSEARSDTSTSILPSLQTTYLPLLTEQLSLEQSRSHIDALVRKHDGEVSDQLLHLSEESHLLPAYPILVKTERSGQEKDRAEGLLEAWHFAIDAAAKATEATIDRQLKNGELAIDKVHAVLDQQEQMNGYWERLE